jgi:hypothetical protein
MTRPFDTVDAWEGCATYRAATRTAIDSAVTRTAEGDEG